MNKTLIRAVALAIVSLSGSANAGFEVISGPEQPPVTVSQAEVITKPLKNTVEVSTSAKRLPLGLPTQAVLTGGINHAGRKPAVIQPARGFAKDVSLREALSMIVPNNIQVYNDGQIDLKNTISWNSKDADDWIGVLDNIFRGLGITATMDWSNSSLSLIQQKKPEVAIKPLPVWRLTKQDGLVRTALMRWAQEAKYNLDWDVPVDYPIPFEVSYQGEFEKVVGDVMGSLKGTDYPVQSCIYENKAIRIVRYGDLDRCKLNQ